MRQFCRVVRYVSLSVPSLSDIDTVMLYCYKKNTIVLIYQQGVSRPNDNRLATPKPYFEYFPTLIPQSACKHRVHLLFSPPSAPHSPLPPPIPIALPPLTRDYGPQSSDETAIPVALEDFGPTTMAPLGHVALARSGDKASDANVGIFVRQNDEWEWLRSFLTIDVFRRLVGQESGGKIIERLVQAFKNFLSLSLSLSLSLIDIKQ